MVDEGKLRLEEAEATYFSGLVVLRRDPSQEEKIGEEREYKLVNSDGGAATKSQVRRIFNSIIEDNLGNVEKVTRENGEIKEVALRFDEISFAITQDLAWCTVEIIHEPSALSAFGESRIKYMISEEVLRSAAEKEGVTVLTYGIHPVEEPNIGNIVEHARYQILKNQVVDMGLELMMGGAALHFNFDTDMRRFVTHVNNGNKLAPFLMLLFNGTPYATGIESVVPDSTRYKHDKGHPMWMSIRTKDIIGNEGPRTGVPVEFRDTHHYWSHISRFAPIITTREVDGSIHYMEFPTNRSYDQHAAPSMENFIRRGWSWAKDYTNGQFVKINFEDGYYTKDGRTFQRDLDALDGTVWWYCRGRPSRRGYEVRVLREQDTPTTLAARAFCIGAHRNAEEIADYLSRFSARDIRRATMDVSERGGMAKINGKSIWTPMDTVMSIIDDGLTPQERPYLTREREAVVRKETPSENIMELVGRSGLGGLLRNHSLTEQPQVRQRMKA